MESLTLFNFSGQFYALLGAALAALAGIGSAIGIGIALFQKTLISSVRCSFFRLFLVHRVFTVCLLPLSFFLK